MISIMLGGLTHHYVGSNLNYCNKINNFGSIANPYVVVMAGNKNSKIGLITGKDSVCANIVGPISSFYIKENLDVIVGGYNVNRAEFKEREIQPFSISGFTPVLGINYKIPITKNISVNNLVSFGIITQSIGINF